MRFKMNAARVNAFLSAVNDLCLSQGILPPGQQTIHRENDESTVEYSGFFINRLTPEQLIEIQGLAAKL